MTVTQQSLAIQAAIKNQVEQLGGEVLIAIDHSQMWEIAANSQDFLVVILCFESQEIRGGEEMQDVSGRVYNHFQAMVRRGRGYDQDVGTDLAGTPPGGANQGSSPPFYDLVEQVRDAIRTMDISDPTSPFGPTNEAPVWFTGIEKVPYDPQVPIYGYLINFKVGTEIGDLVPQNENN